MAKAPESGDVADAAPVSDDACKRLWCDVLLLAIEDAKAPEPQWIERDWQAIAATSKNKRRFSAKAIRAEARRSYLNEHAKWLTDRDYIGSRSFKSVCFLCGLDPDAVEWRVRQQMQAVAA